MRVTKGQLRKIIREAYGNPIGSGDPAQEILDWAEEGNRVTVAGKNIWAGLGSRAGLHSYADEVINNCNSLTPSVSLSLFDNFVRSDSKRYSFNCKTWFLDKPTFSNNLPILPNYK